MSAYSVWEPVLGFHGYAHRAFHFPPELGAITIWPEAASTRQGDAVVKRGESEPLKIPSCQLVFEDSVSQTPYAPSIGAHQAPTDATVCQISGPRASRSRAGKVLAVAIRSLEFQAGRRRLQAIKVVEGPPIAQREDIDGWVRAVDVRGR